MAPSGERRRVSYTVSDSSLAYVESVCQCRAPNSPCRLNGRMASVIASLFSSSSPRHPLGPHVSNTSLGISVLLGIAWIVCAASGGKCC